MYLFQETRISNNLSFHRTRTRISYCSVALLNVIHIFSGKQFKHSALLFGKIS